MVKNPPSNPGDTGSSPGLGTKIPYSLGQLSPHIKTTEPMSSGAHTTTRESPCTATKTQCSQKKERTVSDTKSQCGLATTTTASMIIINIMDRVCCSLDGLKKQNVLEGTQN